MRTAGAAMLLTLAMVDMNPTPVCLKTHHTHQEKRYAYSCSDLERTTSSGGNSFTALFCQEMKHYGNNNKKIEDNFDQDLTLSSCHYHRPPIPPKVAYWPLQLCLFNVYTE